MTHKEAIQIYSASVTIYQAKLLQRHFTKYGDFEHFINSKRPAEVITLWGRSRCEVMADIKTAIIEEQNSRRK